MAEGRNRSIHTKSSSSSRLRIGAVVGSAAVSVAALCAASFAGAAPRRPSSGPELMMSACAEGTGPSGHGFVIRANHEPGEAHRYVWILSIDGKDVLGGTNDMSPNAPDWLDGTTFLIPPSMYPAQIGSVYELRVADRTAQPDRINHLAVVMSDCTGVPRPTTIVG